MSRPEREQIAARKEDLVIIDKNMWEKAQGRWNELEGSWPMAHQGQTNTPQQKSYVHAHPPHLLAGLLTCKRCGGAMVQISGKSGGYYGCYNSKRKTCSNKLLIPRKRLEAMLLNDLKAKFLTPENLEYVYEAVEQTIAKTLNEVPEEVKLKRHERDKVQKELQNLLNFVKAGNFSRVVSEALTDAENRDKKLEGEMQALEFQKSNAFKLLLCFLSIPGISKISKAIECS